ncbi:TIGR04282 family arsenosugar biosynthesis glycosyltransferase [Marinobacter sediminum]|uniref:TIGR04282 family arsenosugar biosynthesis glycosyltransferase n=1 Tax=Marinobacter sediminum TaxID=256323 RepID=UPI00202EFA1F|nr:TIGR04282 family arsenosugar biosynthesis glycosyltransferase [Marinobacter sediminum]MCM0612558.1 TIGR04282 family arsenosugar biosynthesis glycosyltransferase [Marinobacter sediminum]
MPDSEAPKTVLMQFAKWPEEGRVKTRLMPALGASGALDAHVTLTLAVLDNLCASGYPVQFWWDRELDRTPEEARSIVLNLESAGLEQKVQKGATLGDRMLAALGESLESHSRAVVIGSDCPSVDPEYVRQAVARLADFDVILGPSDDGGYVLIGASKVVPGMLDDIHWGTGRVMEQTCERLEKLGLRVSLLEPRWDVDEPEDWARFQRLPRI